MRCRMIGGSRHGQTVSVADPPLAYIQVGGVMTDFDRYPIDLYPIERYRLDHWVFDDFRGTVERAVYVHSSMSKEDAQPYIQGWFETGVIAPLASTPPGPP